MKVKATETESDSTLSLGKVPIYHWLLFSVVVALAGLGIWQSILPFKAERHFRDGFNFDSAGRYKYAVEELEMAVKYAPWETHYQVQLGRTLETWAGKTPELTNKIAKLKQAEAVYLNMLTIDDHNPWYQNRLATIYQELARLDTQKSAYYEEKAEELTRIAANLDKENPLFQLNLAFYLHKTGDPKKVEESIYYYKRVVEIDGGMVEARYNLADIYRRHNKLDKVLEEYLAVYELNPNFQNIRLAVASTLIALNRGQEAIPYLEEEFEVDPKNLDVLKNLTALYHQKQDWDNAAKFYEKLISREPNLESEYHKFYMQSLVSSQKFEKAYTEVVRYLKKHPYDATALEQKKVLSNFLGRP